MRFVKQSRLRQIGDSEGSSLAEPGIIERDKHLVSLSFRFTVEARSVGRFIRC